MKASRSAWCGCSNSQAPDACGSRSTSSRRLDYEIAMIRKMGYSGYFLIVWDFIRYAREEGIPVGPGRGSAAGSLVAWCMRITDVDPLDFDLIFERFLNPERVSLPRYRRGSLRAATSEVIDYVTRSKAVRTSRRSSPSGR